MTELSVVEEIIREVVIAERPNLDDTITKSSATVKRGVGREGSRKKREESKRSVKGCVD